LKQIKDYNIISLLGEGGMGRVYLASKKGTTKLVAIKTIRAELIDVNAIVKRFEREITVGKTLSHPYIIKVLDGGFDEKQNILFLVTEYLKGNSLQELIELGTITIPHIEKIFKQQSKALTYIHGQKILHRDIKPDNIFVCTKERSVLLDFGLSYAKTMTRLSMTSDRPGTLITMSPEQLAGNEPSNTSDIYSLGISMYIALTKTLPYSLEEVMKLASGTLTTTVIPPEKINPHVPSFLNKIVLTCINIDPGHRYENGKELLAALTRKETKRKEIRDDNSNSNNQFKCKKLSSDTRINKRKSLSKKSNKTRQLFFLTFSVIIFGIITVLYFTKPIPTAQMNNDAENKTCKTINKLGDDILKRTISLCSHSKNSLIDLNIVDPEIIVNWMTTMDKLSELTDTFKQNLYKTSYSTNKRELSKLIKNTPLSIYIEGEYFFYNKEYIKAAQCYRDSITKVLEQMFENRKSVRFNNPVAKHILNKITIALSKEGKRKISKESENPYSLILTEHEQMKWYRFHMTLPYQEYMSDDALLIRCWNFLSLILTYSEDNNKKNIKNFEEEDIEVLEPTAGYILFNKKLETLGDGKKLFLKKMVQEKLPLPKQFTGTTKAHSQFNDFWKKKNKTSRTLMVTNLSEKPSFITDNDHKQFLKLYWLMEADILMKPAFNLDRATVYFNSLKNPVGKFFFQKLTRHNLINQIDGSKSLCWQIAILKNKENTYNTLLLLLAEQNLWWETKFLLNEAGLCNKENLATYLIHIAAIPTKFILYKNYLRANAAGKMRNSQKAYNIISKSFKKHLSSNNEIKNVSTNHHILRSLEMQRIHQCLCLLISESFNLPRKKIDMSIISSIKERLVLLETMTNKKTLTGIQMSLKADNLIILKEINSIVLFVEKLNSQQNLSAYSIELLKVELTKNICNTTQKMLSIWRLKPQPH